jgi:16S rRNA (cytidine1402-2'-O)-methyltransferase
MTRSGAGYGPLYVVATPIGNLDDLSPRARAVLARIDVIAAEDTRHSRGLLSSISAESRLIAYHEHNEQERLPELIAMLTAGKSVALVSDAGTPLISDPGWRLVHAAQESGVPVVPVPGACAAIVALCAAGLPTDRFVFEGFLPRRDGPRDERLALLKHERRTLVLYEAVHRIADTLAALVAAFGGERRAAIARELTKVHEQIVVGTLAELATRIGNEIPLLGEFVVVIGGDPSEAAADLDEARRVYALLAAEIEPGTALKLTASITGIARNDLYRLLRT